MSEPEDSKQRLETLLGLEKFLQGEILGQPEACREVAKSILRGELGYNDEVGKDRPRSFMLLLGETGVGKTEMVLSVGRYLYGSADTVIRLDMAEFGDRTAGLARMVGGNRDEQGLIADEMDRVDALLAKVSGRAKGRIVLLDEIEKAHPDVSKLFLGLEAARLTMSNGRVLNFADTHFISTTNLGSECVRDLQGNVPYSAIKQTVVEAARGFFSSPVFARYTEVVVYRSLAYETQVEICRQKLERKLSLLGKRLGRTIQIMPGTLELLVKRGYHRDLGARMMRNTIDREIGNAFLEWEASPAINQPGDIAIAPGRSGLLVQALEPLPSPTHA